MNLFDKGIDSIERGASHLRSQKSDVVMTPEANRAETDENDEENAIFDDERDIPFNSAKEVKNSVTPIRGTNRPSHNRF